jgi:hypothetical protein
MLVVDNAKLGLTYTQLFDKKGKEQFSISVEQLSHWSKRLREAGVTCRLQPDVPKPENPIADAAKHFG